MHGYSYQMTSGDDRIWVHKDGIWVGWLDRETGKIISPVTEAQCSEMLHAALKRKPPKTT